ncbi:hypothetical protein GMOD_00006262 [Pyrenophora seminiperda CCB06]|nr:hypothetical protein GMOD_00006262 [Pyrenophora seminiperda CCB06]
MYRTDAH